MLLIVYKVNCPNMVSCLAGNKSGCYSYGANMLFKIMLLSYSPYMDILVDFTLGFYLHLHINGTNSSEVRVFIRA